jgi:hypothetical protein
MRAGAVCTEMKEMVHAGMTRDDDDDEEEEEEEEEY